MGIVLLLMVLARLYGQMVQVAIAKKRQSFTDFEIFCLILSRSLIDKKKPPLIYWMYMYKEFRTTTYREKKVCDILVFISFTRMRRIYWQQTSLISNKQQGPFTRNFIHYLYRWRHILICIWLVDDNLLLHAVRGSDDPLWVDDAAPAVVTSVVLHRDLPGPAVRDGFSSSHNPCVTFDWFNRWAPTDTVITLTTQEFCYELLVKNKHVQRT